MAGILDLTTADIARRVGAAGQSDGALQAAWALGAFEAEPLFIKATDKLWRFVYIQLRNAGHHNYGYRSGTGYGELRDAHGLSQWMQTFAVGTKFAVWGCGEMNGLYAHWNCAERTQDGVTFTDFQYNYHGRDARTGAHFLAPYTNADDDDEYKKFLGLAFSSEVHR
jgi:hypothetical protein